MLVTIVKLSILSGASYCLNMVSIPAPGCPFMPKQDAIYSYSYARGFREDFAEALRDPGETPVFSAEFPQFSGRPWGSPWPLRAPWVEGFDKTLARNKKDTFMDA